MSYSVLADALAFIDRPMKLPVANGINSRNLNLAMVTAVPPIITDSMKMLVHLQAFTDCLCDQEDTIHVAQSWNDVRVALGVNKLAVLNGLQAPPDDASLSTLSMLRDGGVTVCALAYDKANPFGGGFSVPDVALTDKGEELIRLFADLRIILDLSHSGHRTASDALAFIKSRSIPVKVMASHGGVFEVYDHPRNLKTEHLRDIVSLGGIIGAYFLTFGLHAENNHMESVLPHLDRMLAVSDGIEHVCIGSDGVYQTVDESDARKQFDLMKVKIDPDGSFRSRFPIADPRLNTPNQMIRIADMLSERYGDQTVAGIVGGNLLNFLQRALP